MRRYLAKISPIRLRLIFLMADKLNIFISLATERRPLSYFYQWPKKLIILFNWPQAPPPHFSTADKLYIFIFFAAGATSFFQWPTSLTFLFHWPRRPPSYFFQWPKSLIFLYHWPRGPQSHFFDGRQVLYFYFLCCRGPHLIFFNG